LDPPFSKVETVHEINLGPTLSPVTKKTQEAEPIVCYLLLVLEVKNMERATLDRYHHFHGHSGTCA